MMTVAAILAGAYLVGSIPFAFLLAQRAAGIDLRLAGSGNIGAANVLRTTGTRAGVATVALDAIKGAVVAWAVGHSQAAPVVPALAGLAAIAGHVYPPWLRFRGGKGVATTFGVFAVLAPAAATCSVLCFVAAVWVTRYVSLGSLLSSAALGPFAYVTSAPPAVVVAAIVAAGLIVERHRGNLARLQAGTERRIGQRG